MSKKRVHEIGRELKSHGVELDNKQLLVELVSFGFDVKSHSSSLDDDQAMAAIMSILKKHGVQALALPDRGARPVASRDIPQRTRSVQSIVRTPVRPSESLASPARASGPLLPRITPARRVEHLLGSLRPAQSPPSRERPRRAQLKVPEC